MKIAPLQKQQLDFLNETLTSLESVVERSVRQDFRALSEKLDEWAAKVAVIGQVKAGKSTFLNSFIRQHDFLPSDVNPWTSVVTNIRINVKNDPETGASFEFFSEDDWNEIINGTGNLRKLTEKLLPGFDTTLLKQQSEELRDKAQRRLGKHYHTLLGSKHEYQFLSPDLLKRYVCAGPGSDDGLARESLGRYASLTRVADVYMRIPEFQVPTIVTDTPGVNDPFLVRDEVTCRSLDRSDVFVVVLSAHQALTEVDIGLIRILAQQDGKDVLIFVNRIDELDNYDERYEKVITDVSKRLVEAIPDIEFTIIAGSAFMADSVMRLDDDAQAIRDELDNETLAAYLEKRYGRVPETQEERLMLGSGVDEVKGTLSTVIDNGIGCRQLSQLSEDIRARVSATQYSTRRERESVQSELEKIGARQETAIVEELETEISVIRKVQRDLESFTDSANEQIEGVVNGSWTSLERELHGRVEAFMDEEKRKLEDQVANDTENKVKTNNVEIDLTPLHLMLEEAVTNGFNGARGRIDQALDTCMTESRETFSEYFGEEIENITLDELPFDEFATTLTMSKKSLQVDVINQKSWAFWRRKSVDTDKTMEAVKTLAVAEIRPAIEKLLGAFNEAQSDRASAGMERVAVLRRMIDTTVNERSRRLKNDKRLLEEISADEEKRTQICNRLQSQLEVLERRLQNLSVTESALTAANLMEAA